MIAGRPVATRASLTAASTASAPEFERNACQARRAAAATGGRTAAARARGTRCSAGRGAASRPAPAIAADHPRMGVAGVRDPDPRRVVEVALAVAS